MSASGRTGPDSCDGVSVNGEGGLSAVNTLDFFFLGGDRGQGSGDRSDLEERRIGEVAPGIMEGFFFFLGMTEGSPVRDGSE